MAPAVELRLQHLARSSALLSVSSPSTSAHLSVTRIELLPDTGKSCFPLLIPQCKACGSTAISLQTKWLSRYRSDQKRVPRKRVGNITSLIKPRTIFVRCNTCMRTIKQRFDGPSKVKNTILAVPEVPQPVLHSAESSELRSSSKKRAKARKDRSGLQALLDKSKKDSQPSSGLSLMDFMKAS